MATIYPRGEGNCYQVNRYTCGVPGCGARETVESVIPAGEHGLDVDEGPEGWRLLHGLWVCPNHEVMIDADLNLGKGVGIGPIEIARGEDFWRRNS